MTSEMEIRQEIIKDATEVLRKIGEDFDRENPYREISLKRLKPEIYIFRANMASLYDRISSNTLTNNTVIAHEVLLSIASLESMYNMYAPELHLLHQIKKQDKGISRRALSLDDYDEYKEKVSSEGYKEPPSIENTSFKIDLEKILALLPDGDQEDSRKSINVTEVQKLRMDAALPKNVFYQQKFGMVVSICTLASPKLTEKGLSASQSKIILVQWPKNKNYVCLTIHVEAPGCKIEEKNSRPLRLYAEKNSSKLDYHLTPQKLGEISITITVYQEENIIGGARIPIFVGNHVISSIQQKITHSRIFSGLDPTIQSKLQSVLLKCGPFNSHDKLISTFIDNRISPWRHYVPQVRTPIERVNEIINLLYNQYNLHNENALVLFLRVLSDQQAFETNCHRELVELANKLEMMAKSISIT